MMKRLSAMIQSHLYTNKPQTTVYTENSVTSASISVLGQGNWVGVLEKLDNWFRVLSIQGEGWVKAEDVEEKV